VGYLLLLTTFTSPSHMRLGGTRGRYGSPLGKKNEEIAKCCICSQKAIPSAESLSHLSLKKAQFLDKESQRIKPFSGVKDFALDDTQLLKLLITLPQAGRSDVGDIIPVTPERNTRVPCSPAAFCCLPRTVQFFASIFPCPG